MLHANTGVEDSLAIGFSNVKVRFGAEVEEFKRKWETLLGSLKRGTEWSREPRDFVFIFFMFLNGRKMPACLLLMGSL